MKAIRNVAVVALLAATPLAFAHREGPGKAEGGCQCVQPSAEGAQERHAQRHARMAAMHQGMQGMGMGVHQGAGRGHRHEQTDADESTKK